MTEAEQTQSYYRQRAQRARESAMRSAEPAVRRIHLDMAERYEVRSRAADPVTPLMVSAIEDR